MLILYKIWIKVISLDQADQLRIYWRMPRGVSLPVSAYARTLNSPPPPTPPPTPPGCLTLYPFQRLFLTVCSEMPLLIRNRPHAHVFGRLVSIRLKATSGAYKENGAHEEGQGGTWDND